MTTSFTTHSTLIFAATWFWPRIFSNNWVAPGLQMAGSQSGPSGQS